MDKNASYSNMISTVFGHRWMVVALVAGIWCAVVTLYVLSGLSPHEYIGDETEALMSWLGWTAGGSLLLAWLVRKSWFGSSTMRRPQATGVPKHTMPPAADELEDTMPWHADSRDECALRMGVAGFGYYCGAIRTDDD